MAGIVITGLLVGLATAIPLYQHSREHNEAAMGFQVRSQAQALGQLLEKYRDVAQQFSSRTQIRAQLEAYNRGEIELTALIDYTVPRMADALRQTDNVVGLLRLDASQQAAVPIGEIPEDLPWQGLNLDLPIARLHGPFRSGDHYTLLVSSPIIGRDGSQVGTDLVLFQMDGLAALMATHLAFGNDISQYLYNHQVGGILALQKGGDFGWLDTDEAQQLLEERASPHFPVRLADNGNKLAYYAAIPGINGWQLIITLPDSSIYQPARRQLFLPLLAILLMVAIGLIGTARMMRPLSREVIEGSRRLSEVTQEQQALLDLAHGFAFRLDTRGAIHYATPGIEQVLGISLAELPLHQSRIIPDEEANSLALQQLRELLQQADEPMPFLVHTRHANGHSLILEIHARAMLEDGRVTGIRAIGRDVSQRIADEQSRLQSIQEWSYAMDFFDHAIFLVDLEDKVVRANRALYEMLALPADKVIGHDITQLMHPHGEDENCPVCRARHMRQDINITLDADDPDNPIHRPVEMTTRVIHDSNGEATGILMGIQDLTRARQTEEQLRLAASVFEGSQEGIMIMGTDRRIVETNKAFTHITGRTRESVSGQQLKDFIDHGQLDDDICEQIWQQVDTEDGWEGELWYRRLNGEIFPAWQNLSVVRNSQGKPQRYIGVFTDISRQKASEARIQHLAHYDLLTSLPNRLLLQDRLLNAMERMKRGKKKLAVLFLDLDRFKNVNDSLGHPIGDELLKVVAERLRGQIREQDTVARHGGDEFLIILEELHDPQHAASVAQKLLTTLTEPVIINHHQLFIGASIGISIYPDDGDNADTLVTNADTAMYRAKETGRNTYQFYTPELTELSLERFELERDLRLALERGELLLHYQPQASLENEVCVGVEALVRWLHPEKGLIAPDRFIPLAEETGLIEELGQWVLRESAAQAQRWQQQGIALRMAVNISGRQIVYGNLVRSVEEILHSSGLEPHCLELEITEGFVLSHADEGIRTLEQLKELGVLLAIDDFGTGYSSLSYLKRLPIDRLKIDKSFVQGIPDDADEAAIASTIIAMGRSLRLEVIAEGVETPAQQQFMLEKGCNEFQGYFLGRPMSAEDFLAWWHQRSSTQAKS